MDGGVMGDLRRMRIDGPREYRDTPVPAGMSMLICVDDDTGDWSASFVATAELGPPGVVALDFADRLFERAAYRLREQQRALLPTVGKVVA